MKKKHHLISLIFLFVIPLYNFGQLRQTIIWNSFQFPVVLNEKWQIHNDISYRTIGTSFSAYQYSYRTGLRRKFNNRWTTAAGFAIFYTRRKFEKSDHEFGSEFRLWQEGVKESRLGKGFSMFNRLRTEERFFAATAAKDKYSALRLLYKLSFVETLTSKWKIQIADEYMEQLTGDKFAFQQNRLGVIAILSLDANTQFQAGYLRGMLPSVTQHNIIFTFTKTIIANEHRHKV